MRQTGKALKVSLSASVGSYFQERRRLLESERSPLIIIFCAAWRLKACTGRARPSSSTSLGRLQHERRIGQGSECPVQNNATSFVAGIAFGGQVPTVQLYDHAASRANLSLA